MTADKLAEALRSFTAWFTANYPGPDTIISDPNWHAPRIFRAARYALMLDAEAAQIRDARDAWQPIETAPKDGTRILLCDDRCKPFPTLLGSWCHGSWWSDATRSGASIVWDDATHWMPLPKPPSRAREGRQGGAA